VEKLIPTEKGFLNRKSERIPRPPTVDCGVNERLNNHLRRGGFVERLQAAKQRSTKCHCLSLHARTEQGDANNLKMVNFPPGRRPLWAGGLTVEDSLSAQVRRGRTGIFNTCDLFSGMLTCRSSQQKSHPILLSADSWSMVMKEPLFFC